MALVFLRHVIMTVVFCSMTSYTTVSRTFKVKVGATGSQMCAVDKPSAVITMAASTMGGQCGVKCNVDPSCELFQFKEDSAQCELFDYSPANFSTIDHCTAYSAPRSGVQTGRLVTSWSGTTSVLATAVHNGELFVTRASVSVVSVYDPTSFQRLRQFNFTGLGTSTALLGLATSTANNNYLYVSDYFNQRVHRVDVSATSNLSAVTWSVPGTPRGLSVTGVGNVLVALSSPSRIQEYTSDGSLVRVITNSNDIWQAVEVSRDIWAFTVRGPMKGIRTTLTNGILIKCLTASTASSGTITQMVDPRNLVVGPRGYIFVADRGNSMILTVDPSVTVARQLLLLNPNTGPTNPVALSVDESRGRLYSGEDGAQYRVLVFDGIW